MHVNRSYKVLGFVSLATLPLLMAFQNMTPSGSPPARCPLHLDPTENGLISHASFDDDGTKLRSRPNPRYPRLLLQADEQRYLPMIIYPRFLDNLDPHTGITRKVAVVTDDVSGCRPGNQALMIRQGPIKEYCEKVKKVPQKIMRESPLDKFNFDNKTGDCKMKEKMEVWVLPEHYGTGKSGRVTEFSQGERRFLGFSLKLDPTYQAPASEAHWTIHMQVHQDTMSEVSGRSQPSLTLSAYPTSNPDRVRFRVKIKQEKENKLIEHLLPADDFITLQKGRWYSFAFDILPDADSKNGHVRFFVRNEKGLIGGPYTYRGAWSYKAKKAKDRTFNLSVGLYRARQEKLHLFYLDDIRFGKNMGNVAPWAIAP